SASPAGMHATTTRTPAFSTAQSPTTHALDAADAEPRSPAGGATTLVVPASRAVPRTFADSARRTSAQIGHVLSTPDSRIAYAAPPTTEVDTSNAAHPSAGDAHPGVGGVPSSGATGAAAATRSGGTAAAPASDSTAGDSIAERALSSAGRLPPSVLGDMLRQREQLLQYCYTAFGLKVDHALAGQIVARIVIQQDGSVSDVSVARRSWSGRGADAVESCVRDRVSRWQFPAAQRASTHEIQLIFGR